MESDERALLVIAAVFILFALFACFMAIRQAVVGRTMTITGANGGPIMICPQDEPAERVEP